MWEGMAKFLQNPATQYAMASMGQALDPQGVGAGLGGMVKQNIQAQNKMKLIQQMLSGGKIPKGGQILTKEDGITIKLPTLEQGEFSGNPSNDMTLQPSSTQQSSGMNQGIAQGLNQGGLSTQGPQNNQVSALMKMLLGGGGTSGMGFSPSQLNVSAADLVGLTPQDIDQAVQFKFMQDQLGQKQMTDVSDMVYKGALTSEATARTKQIQEPDPLDQPYLTSPAGDAISYRQAEKIPKDTLRYYEYVNAAKKAGKEPMREREWNLQEPTAQIQTLTQMQKNPSLLKTQKELNESSRTQINLGDVAAKKRTLDEIERESKILDPTFSQKTYESITKDARNWRASVGDESETLAKDRGIPIEKAQTVIKRTKHREAMDAQIKQVWPNAYWKGDGWYVDNRLIKRDPYVK